MVQDVAKHVAELSTVVTLLQMYTFAEVQPAVPVQYCMSFGSRSLNFSLQFSYRF